MKRPAVPRDREGRGPWRPPTRRAFVAMIGAAAAALALRDHAKPGVEPRKVWTGKPRWIGHC